MPSGAYLTEAIQPLNLRYGLAGTNDGGADPHQGRTEADGGFEIGAHSHAEFSQDVAPGDFTLNILCKCFVSLH
jgi:hypothetical protein